MSHTDSDRPLPDSPFTPLRTALAQHTTPRYVEKELMQAFAQRYPRRRWWQALLPSRPARASLAGAALVAAVWLLALQPPRPLPGGAPAAGLDDSFIALDSFDRIAQEPQPQLLQTEVAGATLAALGVAVDPEDAGTPIRAELLVGADGHPLALRLTSLH